MRIESQKQITTKSGTYQLIKYETESWMFVFREKKTDKMEAAVITQPLARFIGDAFDFMESKKRKP